MPLVLAAVATLISLPLVAGYWGRVHPAFDSLAHFRMHLAVLLVCLSLPLLAFKGWRTIGATGAVLGLAAMSAALLPAAEAGPTNPQAANIPQARYRLLQLNLRYDNAILKQVFSLIGEVQPDVVTLNEVSEMWAGELKYLEASYPYRIVCPPPAAVGGVAILSRRPFLHPSLATCKDRGAMAVTTIDIGGSALDVVALHLGWPWPFEQHGQVKIIATELQSLGATAILAGDLNATPWSVTAQRIANAGGFTMVKGIGPTWFKTYVPETVGRIVDLPIDNIFTKGRVVPFSVKRLRAVGSDHLPVLLEFGILPDDNNQEVIQALAE